MLLPVSTDIVDDKRVRFHRSGRGATLILLHGYPDNLQIWSAVAPLLSSSLDVIAFDWPGMGASEPWTGGATPFHMADRLLALMDHWRIERAAICGIDMGGQPALVAAARHPERISHAIVTGSLLQWDAPTSWDIRLLRRFRFNEFFLKRFPRFVFRRALSTFGATVDEDVREDFWECFRRRDVRDYIVRMCAGYEGTLPRLPAEYERITVPALAIWGTDDRHFPAVHAQRLAHAALRTIDGGHWLPLQKSEEFATIVSRFVRRSP